MYTEESYEDYLQRQNILALFPPAIEDDGLERCPMCGDRHLIEDMGEYKGQRMCCRCENQERENVTAGAYGFNMGEMFEQMMLAQAGQ